LLADGRGIVKTAKLAGVGVSAVQRLIRFEELPSRRVGDITYREFEFEHGPEKLVVHRSME
jgi:hypothetical protein